MKTYGLFWPSTLPIHMKFSISFFENISYRDLIFDRWKKKNIDLEISLQKLEPKYSYGFLKTKI
jgi:hypothetical protein